MKENMTQKQRNLQKHFIAETENSKNLSKLTINSYNSDLKDFLNFKDYLEDIDQNNILEYVEHLRLTKKLKNTTIKRKIVTLRMFIKLYMKIN